MPSREKQMKMYGLHPREVDEPLLNPEAQSQEEQDRKLVYPTLYPKLWNMFETHCSTFWLHTEIIITEQDIKDYNSLSENEKYFVKQVLGWFAFSDIQVLENLSYNMIRKIKNLETSFFYGIQMNIEQIHSIVYNNFITDLMSSNEREEVEKAVENFEAVKLKTKWAERWIGNGHMTTDEKKVGSALITIINTITDTDSVSYLHYLQNSIKNIDVSSLKDESSWYELEPLSENDIGLKRLLVLVRLLSYKYDPTRVDVESSMKNTIESESLMKFAKECNNKNYDVVESMMKSLFTDTEFVEDLPSKDEFDIYDIKAIEPKKEDVSFHMRVLVWSLLEGVGFQSSFAAIFWLKERGLLETLAFSNKLISRDENLHADFAIELYKHLKNPFDEETVHQITKEMVNVEKTFVEKSLPVSLLGMNEKTMKQFVEYVADRHLDKLGYNKIWNSKQPFDFIEKHMTMTTSSNYFETRVAEYAIGNLGHKNDENEACGVQDNPDDVDF